MPTTTIPNLALSGPDPVAIARALAPAAPPDSVDVDGAATDPAGRGLVAWLDGADDVQATWGRGRATRSLLFQRKHALVKASLPVWPVDVEALLAALAAVPFELASFTTLHDEWIDDGYLATGFGGGHYPHGWACAFRGAGHDRLVSTRWLEHGPWRLHRRDDLTLVQFHDLDAAPGDALAQARTAHRRMGFGDHGGFLRQPHAYKHDLAGVHLARLRTQRVLVVDRDVSQREMLDACALRVDKRDDAEKPIEQVGFVFLERARAEKHLHELWLRGLECWTNEGGREVRLDEGYAPPASQVPWT